MDAQNYKKKLYPKAFDFCENSADFFVKYCIKRRCSQIEPQLKVKIEDVL